MILIIKDILRFGLKGELLVIAIAVTMLNKVLDVLVTLLYTG